MSKILLVDDDPQALESTRKILEFSGFTVVTASYHAGPLTGVIGVIGPTRMPYDKVISLVTHASELVTDLLKENSRPHG